MNKLEFLTDEFTIILSSMDPETPPVFGKMNFHQMVEHMSYAFRRASGLILLKSKQEEALTSKMYQFMMSDKPFKDNTPNSFLPNEPNPIKHKMINNSIAELQNDIDSFVNKFKNSDGLRIPNPFFGNLNFDEWTQLLHKHALHHLRQFGFE
jgi:hypothetical protein